MVNSEMLKAAIERNNLSISDAAAAIGIDRSTFYRKIENASFTVIQALNLSKVLHMTAEEFQEIFLR